MEIPLAREQRFCVPWSLQALDFPEAESSERLMARPPDHFLSLCILPSPPGQQIHSPLLRTQETLAPEQHVRESLLWNLPAAPLCLLLGMLRGPTFFRTMCASPSPCSLLSHPAVSPLASPCPSCPAVEGGAHLCCQTCQPPSGCPFCLPGEFAATDGGASLAFRRSATTAPPGNFQTAMDGMSSPGGPRTRTRANTSLAPLNSGASYFHCAEPGLPLPPSRHWCPAH